MPLFLSKKDMANALTTAFEGGSNYWIERIEYIAPDGMSGRKLREIAWAATDEDERSLFGDMTQAPLYALLPFLPASVKWQIRITRNDDDEKAVLTPANMRGALTVLHGLDPKAAKAIREDTYDANDADSWLQAAVLGELVYG